MFSSAIKIVLGSIFPLFSINRKKIRVLGTGFFIDNKGHFITAKHVIDAIESGSHLGYLGNVPREKFHKKKPRQVKIIFSDPEKDLAIGKTDQEPLPGLVIADSEPDLGASICLCGYPLPSVTETSGQHTKSFDVSAVRQYWQPTIVMDYIRPGFIYKKQYRSFLTQHASLPGMSGGPIFDTLGRVVGVNLANWTRVVPRNPKVQTQVENGIGLSTHELKNFIAGMPEI